MRPLAYTISGAFVAAALALGPSTVWAQSRPSGSGQGGPGGARTSSGGSSSGGSAVSRGDAGGGSSTSSGGSSGSSIGSSGGSSGGSVNRPSGGGAVRSSSGGVRVNPQRLGVTGSRGEAVPRGARPNYDNRTTGRATGRVGQPPSMGGDRNYYWPYGGYGGYYGSGYGPYYYGGYGSYYGMRPWSLGGLYFYNPFWWGYGYPFGLDTYGGPYTGDYYGAYGYGYGGGYGTGTGYGYGPYGDSSRQWGRGGLKLKVKPREAEVYVDGFYMGQVDNFDGTFQQLELEPGGHRVEIRARGFETISFEVNIDPRETITYRGELQALEIK